MNYKDLTKTELLKELLECKKIENLLACQRQVLELLAQDVQLIEVLDYLCETVEKQFDGHLCSILLFTKGSKLYCAAAPSIPDSFKRAVENLTGPCHEAACRQEPLYVQDVTSDPLCKDCRDLALQYGIKACWSAPILSSHKKVLGTLAIYYREPCCPDPHNLKLLNMATHLAGIAIECKQAQEELKKCRDNLKERVHKKTQQLEKTNVLLKQEIVEKMKTEKALEESEERYRRLVELSPNAISVHQDDRIVFANAATAKLFHAPKPEELIGKPIMNFLRKRHWDLARKRFERVIAGEAAPPVEYEAVRLDDTIAHVEITSIPFIYQGKPAVQLVGHDVTERKKTENELRESEERYRRLVELSPDAIVVYCDNIIVFANTATAKLLGVNSIEDIIGKPVLSFVHPDYLRIAKERIELVLKDRKTIPVIEQKFVRVDGKVIVAETVTTPFTFKGKPAIQSICRDITARKRLEEQHQNMEKLESIGILAGGIAHDFNNILTVIKGNISLAKLYISGANDALIRLSESEKAVNQAVRLTKQLLTFSKGGLPVKKVTPFKDLLKDTISLVLSGSNIKCQYNIAAELLPVETDEGQMSQVINNIIINAMQAMPEGGTTHVTVENATIGSREASNLQIKEGQYIKLTITDEGDGITEEHLPKIFDPYFTTKQQGSGLGLAISYSIIRKHNGYITAESEIGVGTTFYIYLPATSAERDPQTITTEKILSGRGRILIMDDESGVRKVAKEMLVKLGYVVESAPDGAEAIRIYKRAHTAGHPFDAVIIDLTIPGGLGGKKTIKELLQLNPKAKAIVSSGYSSDPIIANFKEFGFKGCVSKPYEIEELGTVVGKVIRGDS